jgi:hypothetical protein
VEEIYRAVLARKPATHCRRIDAKVVSRTRSHLIREGFPVPRLRIGSYVWEEGPGPLRNAPADVPRHRPEWPKDRAGRPRRRLDPVARSGPVRRPRFRRTGALSRRCGASGDFPAVLRWPCFAILKSVKHAMLVNDEGEAAESRRACSQGTTSVLSPASTGREQREHGVPGRVRNVGRISARWTPQSRS